MKTLLCAVILSLAHTCTAQTPSHLPAFNDYPVASEQAPTTTHKVVIAGAQSRQYASMLRNAAGHPPDFAGHYILASWGCGASCVQAAAINANDGKVVWLPFTVCCWPLEVTEPLDFKLDSRLLIVHGSRNEKGSGTHYYLLDAEKQRFVPLPTTPQPPEK